jgi:hypothetical protein
MAVEMHGSNEDFFSRLRPVEVFDQAVDTTLHVDVPTDWWTVVADVEGSTRAIAEGRYKQVNTVGVACIAAVLNLDRTLRLPYVFGGDGATLAIPPRLLPAAESALRGAQRLARDGFGLALRVGLVSVADLRAMDARVRVTKVRLSAKVDLPVLSGRGWEEAERRLKEADLNGIRRLAPDDDPADADFSGFECRWQEVPAARGVKLSLIVLGRSPDPQQNRQALRQTLDAVRRCIGSDAESHPIRLSDLRLTNDLRDLMGERRVRTFGQGVWAAIAYQIRLWSLNLVGACLFRRDEGRADRPWGRYKADLIQQSDHRKFDGTLRMVVDAREDQVTALTDWLEARRQEGHLVYGVHRAQSALITCIVHQHDGDHIHFVDGADGGYALAARQLKAQLRESLSAAQATPAEPGNGPWCDLD